jgi:hypothetical protein
MIQALGILLRFGLAGFTRSAAGAGNCFGLGCFGNGLHCRVPIDKAAAAVAGEQLALTKLVPGLRANAHAASGALLILGAGDSGAASACDAVEAHQPIGFNGRTDGLAGSIEASELGRELLLASADMNACGFKSFRKGFNLGARLRENGFLSFGAIEAGEFLVFQPVGFRSRELNLVFDGRGLLRGLDGIELSAEALGLLAVSVDLAFQAGAERFFPAQCPGGFGRLALGGSKSSLRLGDFSGQSAHLVVEAGAVQFDGLQLYEAFNQRLHR